MSAVRVQTDPRITRRRQAVARSKRRRLLIGAGALTALALVLWTMFWSPLLAVRAVKVVGADRTGKAPVVEATEIVGTGENLLLVPARAVEGRVERLPWVADATVERILPSTVRVTVIEREPAFVLALDGGRWTIDDGGHVLAVGKAERGLPVLAGTEVGHVEPGVVLQTEEARGALEVYGALPAKIRKRVGKIFAPTPERISFKVKGGPEVRYGAARQMAAKATVLKALLKRLASDRRAASYIDVRVPTSPAIGLGAGRAEVSATTD